jgi:16S rRNA (guanine966-N2)-methyltransferase
LRKKHPKTKNKGKSSNTLRIIGGQWRSRKLPFVDAQGLRPTPDRIRETLFNWLQGEVRDARCLDLFAGSGALGIEALSRGAAEVTFIETNPAVVSQLKANLTLLKSDAPVAQDDALAFLAKQANEKPFDLIFLDPPYRQGLLEKSLLLISEHQLLNDNGLIYLEHESEEHFDWNKYGLNILKQAKAGQVSCFLLKP